MSGPLVDRFGRVADDLPADDGTHARGIARRPPAAQHRGTPVV